MQESSIRGAKEWDSRSQVHTLVLIEGVMTAISRLRRIVLLIV